LILDGLDRIEPIETTINSEEFNSNYSYVPRSKRKEWIPVGLMGKLYVRDNGLCVPGKKCSCLNGIAVPGTDWSVLSRSGPNSIRILYK
jgi:hypothetical protein